MMRIVCWAIGHRNPVVYEFWVRGVKKRLWAECTRCQKTVWIGDDA